MTLIRLMLTEMTKIASTRYICIILLAVSNHKGHNRKHWHGIRVKRMEIHLSPSSLIIAICLSPSLSKYIKSVIWYWLLYHWVKKFSLKWEYVVRTKGSFLWNVSCSHKLWPMRTSKFVVLGRFSHGFWLVRVTIRIWSFVKANFFIISTREATIKYIWSFVKAIFIDFCDHLNDS